jgi:hypothetical protein
MLLDVLMRRKRPAKPVRIEVTAARSPGVDFAHLKPIVLRLALVDCLHV